MFVIDLPAALVLALVIAVLVLVTGIAIAKHLNAREAVAYRTQAVAIVEALIKEPLYTSDTQEQLMAQLLTIEEKAPGRVSEAFDTVSSILNAAWWEALRDTSKTDQIPAIQMANGKLQKWNATFHQHLAPTS